MQTLDYVRRQIAAVGKKHVVFIDNNFYGNDREFFHARLDLLREFHQAGRIAGWSAIVTSDLFADPGISIRQGPPAVTRFSAAWNPSIWRRCAPTTSVRKNLAVPQVKMIRTCLDAGILFLYGIMLDPSMRSLADMRHEIEFILDTARDYAPLVLHTRDPAAWHPIFQGMPERAERFIRSRACGISMAPPSPCARSTPRRTSWSL